MLTSLPEFVQINSLVVQGENLLAVATAFESCIFDEHFYAFQLTRGIVKKTILINIRKMPECEPLYILKGFGDNHFEYVAPRHVI